MFEREIRLVPQIEKTPDSMRVSFCYPGTYEIGMAGLGFQLVWWLMEQHQDVIVQRCFEDIEEKGVGPSRSDLVGFTLSWELDILNVITMMQRYKVETIAQERSENDPIVFGGGPVLSANPEPYHEIFDVILMGDAEATIDSLIEVTRESKGLSRKEKLLMYSKKPGLYVPSLYSVRYKESVGELESIKPVNEFVSESVAKQTFKAPDGYIAKTCLLSPDTIWGANYLIEVVRSCPQECRFCLASYLTRPFRFASVETIINTALDASKHTDKIGLLGPSITEHPQFEEIADRLMAIGGLRVNIASVRADTLSKSLTTNIAKLGQKSVTIALESGSQRLRDIMKKNLSEEQIRSAVSAIEDGGLSGVKFYGIAGLPYEEQEDLDETVRLLSELKKEHSKLKFVFGLSSFVPKAQTPFQRMGRDRASKKKIEYLRKKLARIGIDVRPESHNWSDVQALLSRGDRRLSRVINKILNTGSSVGNWKRAVKENSDFMPSLDYYIYDNYPENQVLPWSHLDNPEKRDFLEKHLADATELAQGK